MGSKHGPKNLKVDFGHCGSQAQLEILIGRMVI